MWSKVKNGKKMTLIVLIDFEIDLGDTLNYAYRLEHDHEKTMKRSWKSVHQFMN